MRGADAGSIEMMVAQSALWTGLLYDDAALAAADALVREQPWDAYRTLRAQVPERGLDADWPSGTGNGTVRALAARMVAIANDGLAARGLRDAQGRDERRHLEPLLPIVQGAPTQAEHWLSRYRTDWNGDATRIFLEAAI
jgi:glutamate--cysteine ligase